MGEKVYEYLVSVKTNYINEETTTGRTTTLPLLGLLR